MRMPKPTIAPAVSNATTSRRTAPSRTEAAGELSSTGAAGGGTSSAATSGGAVALSVVAGPALGGADGSVVAGAPPDIGLTTIVPIMFEWNAQAKANFPADSKVRE